jgi:hypothetical protein
VAIDDHSLDDRYLDDSDDDLLPPPARRKVPALTAVLIVAVIAIGGFFSGVLVQKHLGKPKTTNVAAALATAGATGNAAAGGATGGAAGLGGGGAGGTGRTGGRTAGLVTNVQTGMISITDAQGNVVKITTKANPTVSKTDQGSLSDIKIGDTLIVQGQKAADGSVAASSITLGSGPGGFAGGGGAGGAGGGG